MSESTVVSLQTPGAPALVGRETEADSILVNAFENSHDCNLYSPTFTQAHNVAITSTVQAESYVSGSSIYQAARDLNVVAQMSLLGSDGHPQLKAIEARLGGIAGHIKSETNIVETLKNAEGVVRNAKAFVEDMIKKEGRRTGTVINTKSKPLDDKLNALAGSGHHPKTAEVSENTLKETARPADQIMSGIIGLAIPFLQKKERRLRRSLNKVQKS